MLSYTFSGAALSMWGVKFIQLVAILYVTPLHEVHASIHQGKDGTHIDRAEETVKSRSGLVK